MKTTINLISILFVLMLSNNKLYAEQIGEVTQYMFAPSLINPAYVGVDDASSVIFLHRTQWVGVKGAPVTQGIVLTMPLKSYLGLGFSVVKDEIGPANETDYFIDISYLLKLNDNGLNFSFGMKGGVQVLDVDYSKLNTRNPIDGDLNNNVDSKISPIVGAGIYLYNQDWYIGVSSPNLLIAKHYHNSKRSTGNSIKYSYLTAGKNFLLTEKIKFKPSFLLKYASGSPLSADFSLNFLFRNKFATGFSYRYNAAFSGFMKIKLNSFLTLGYSYDLSTSSDIKYFSGGSHEVFLKVSLKSSIKNARQPRWLY